MSPTTQPIQPTLRKSRPDDARFVGAQLSSNGGGYFDPTTGELNIGNPDPPFQQNGTPATIREDAPYGKEWVQRHLTNLRRKWNDPYYSFLMQVSGACAFGAFQTDGMQIGTDVTRNVYPSDETLAQRVVSALNEEDGKAFVKAVIENRAPSADFLRQIFGDSQQETNLPWSMELENLGTVRVNEMYTFAINICHRLLEERNRRVLDLKVLITGDKIKPHFVDIVARKVTLQLYISGQRVSTQALIQRAETHFWVKVYELGNLKDVGRQDYEKGAPESTGFTKHLTYSSYAQLVDSHLNARR